MLWQCCHSRQDSLINWQWHHVAGMLLTSSGWSLTIWNLWIIMKSWGGFIFSGSTLLEWNVELLSDRGWLCKEREGAVTAGTRYWPTRQDLGNVFFSAVLLSLFWLHYWLCYYTFGCVSQEVCVVTAWQAITHSGLNPAVHFAKCVYSSTFTTDVKGCLTDVEQREWWHNINCLYLQQPALLTRRRRWIPWTNVFTGFPKSLLKWRDFLAYQMFVDRELNANLLEF